MYPTALQRFPSVDARSKLSTVRGLMLARGPSQVSLSSKVGPGAARCFLSKASNQIVIIVRAHRADVSPQPWTISRRTFDIAPGGDGPLGKASARYSALRD
jgi:hypothetical protein